MRRLRQRACRILARAVGRLARTNSGARRALIPGRFGSQIPGWWHSGRRAPSPESVKSATYQRPLSLAKEKTPAQMAAVLRRQRLEGAQLREDVPVQDTLQ